MLFDLNRSARRDFVPSMTARGDEPDVLVLSKKKKKKRASKPAAPAAEAAAASAPSTSQTANASAGEAATPPIEDDDLFSLGLPTPVHVSCLAPAPVLVPALPRKKREREEPTADDEGRVDRRLWCKDCGQVFLFSKDKQRELEQKGFKAAVKTRCEPSAKYKNRFGARLR